MIDYAAHFQLHLESLRPPYHPSSRKLRVFASEAGMCDRKIHYRLMRALGESDLADLDPEETPSYTTSIAYHIGNNLHDEYQAMMAFLHKDFTGERKWVYPNAENPVISGRCDGTYTNNDGQTIALEIKTASRWMYTRSLDPEKGTGLPDPHHALQAAMSCAMLRTDLVQVVYICKEYVPELDPIHIWTYAIAPRLVADEAHRLGLILSNAKQRGPTPPRRVWGDTITNPERHPECRFCPYLDDCIIEGPPFTPEPRKSRRRKSS